MQLAAIVVSLVISVIGFGLLFRTAAYIYQFVRLGQKTVPGKRTNDPVERTRTLFREFLEEDMENGTGEVPREAMNAVSSLMVMMVQRLEKDMKGRPPPQRLVLTELTAALTTGRAEARKRLEAAIEGLESADFGRRFLSFVAVETM